MSAAAPRIGRVPSNLPYLPSSRFRRNPPKQLCARPFHADRIVKSESDIFTLDTPALLAAVEAASARSIDFLWLDCWAYRRQPPWGEYDHDHFCHSLTAVMQHVDLVLWLPRSRAAAAGQYQYRIWTTFEARA